MLRLTIISTVALRGCDPRVKSFKMRLRDWLICALIPPVTLLFKLFLTPAAMRYCESLMITEFCMFSLCFFM